MAVMMHSFISGNFLWYLNDETQPVWYQAGGLLLKCSDMLPSFF